MKPSKLTQNVARKVPYDRACFLRLYKWCVDITAVKLHLEDLDTRCSQFLL
jgi:hypothetical protein